MLWLVKLVVYEFCSFGWAVVCVICGLWLRVSCGS